MWTTIFLKQSIISHLHVKELLFKKDGLISLYFHNYWLYGVV